MKRFLMALCLAGTCAFGVEAQELNIVPRPVEVKATGTTFTINRYTALRCESECPEFKTQTEFIRSALNKGTGLSASGYRTQQDNVIIVRQASDLNEYGDEAYRIEVGEKQIILSAPTGRGIFYAGQSLTQLLDPSFFEAGIKAERDWIVPGCTITDYPRFSWRTLSLDEARHFFGETAVKQIIDQMALLKMNTLHWHLTNDAGWRIEIKKYPLLTEVGSKRDDSETGTWGSGKSEGKPYQGFYTQEQIKRIVAYAAERNVTIVPEFCVPGHMMAAAVAYPYLSLLKYDKVATKFVDNAAIDPTEERTYKFISDVLDEYVELFPGKVIHMGGDEVRYGKVWKGQPKIEKFMKDHNLKSFTDLQVYFTNRVSQIVKSKGRRMIGWNEILGHDLNHERVDASELQLDRDAIVQFWKGSAAFAKGAAELGHQVVNALHNYTYLDYGYGSISLKKAYDFDPIGILKGLEEKYHKNVIGFGCQTWTEWITDVPRLHYQIFPRVCAFAEVGWTPLANRDFEDFQRRMKSHYKRMDACGIQYAAGIAARLAHADFFNTPKVGQWTPKMLKDAAATGTFEFNVSEHVTKAGDYEFTFLYEKGGCRLDINRVSIAVDGSEVAVDEHFGFSGTDQNRPIYKLKVKDAPKAGAKVTLRVKGAGSGGDDSTGIVYVKSL